MKKTIRFNVTYDKNKTPIYRNANDDIIFSYQLIKDLSELGYRIVYQYPVN